MRDTEVIFLACGACDIIKHLQKEGESAKLLKIIRAGVAKLADMLDLKSSSLRGECGFCNGLNVKTILFIQIHDTFPPFSPSYITRPLPPGLYTGSI